MGELAVLSLFQFLYLHRGVYFTYIACGVGWSYWFNWVVYIPAECIAAALSCNISPALMAMSGSCIGLLITYVNMSEVGTFGEIEFVGPH